MTRSPAGPVAVVVTRDLPAGAVLAEEDLRTVELSAAAMPSGALHDVATAVGRPLAMPVGSGEALTPTRLSPAGLLTGQPAGTRVVVVPGVDPASLSVVHPGTRVDVYLAGSATAVLTDSLVVRVIPGEDPALALAVTADDAGRVSAGLVGPDGTPRLVTVALRGS